MSRGIPPVSIWRVRYYGADGATLATIDVRAVNRRFARWAARDSLMRAGQWLAIWHTATRDSVAKMKDH